MEELKQFFQSDLEGISASKLNSATYYACMLIRCNALAKLPLKLMQETERGSVKAVKESLYHLMKNRPNPFMNTHDFLWSTEFQRLEYGNAYWFLDTDEITGQITAVYLLDSRQMEIMIDDTAILQEVNAVYYLYHDAKSGMQIYTNDQIVHFKNFPKNGIAGSSIRQYLSDVIDAEQHAQKLIKGKYRDGLQDPIIVVYTGDLNNETNARIKKKFAALGGAKNAGKVVPIPSEFDVKQLETKLVNSQFFELQGLNSRQIANGFGVKGFQLNDMEKSTYNNIEQQNRAFYSDTLQNVVTTYEQEMDYKMLNSRQKEIGCCFQFNVDVILRSDILTRYQAYEIGIANAFLKPSEVRQKENYPFVAGTDQLYFGNGAVIPLADAGKQYMKGDETIE